MHWRSKPSVSMGARVCNYTVLCADNHSLFVHRMIGSKMGTGGSGGYEYLRRTVER